MFNELYFSLSLISALFIYSADYGLGKPGDDKPNYNSLLFFWSFYLAKKRLIEMGGLGNLYRQLYEQLSNANTKIEKRLIRNSFKEIVFLTARPLFTYENILGMCPICTHFWVSLLIFISVNIFYFKVNIITFGLYFLLSHLFLRIFKRI